MTTVNTDYLLPKRMISFEPVISKASQQEGQSRDAIARTMIVRLDRPLETSQSTHIDVKGAQLRISPESQNRWKNLLLELGENDKRIIQERIVSMGTLCYRNFPYSYVESTNLVEVPSFVEEESFPSPILPSGRLSLRPFLKRHEERYGLDVNQVICRFAESLVSQRSFYGKQQVALLIKQTSVLRTVPEEQRQIAEILIRHGFDTPEIVQTVLAAAFSFAFASGFLTKALEWGPNEIPLFIDLDKGAPFRN